MKKKRIPHLTHSDFVRSLNADAKTLLISGKIKDPSLINGLSAVLEIPVLNLWMLAVDGKFFKIENGPIGFAKREKNCLPGILRGLSIAIKSAINLQFTIEELQRIHFYCMQNIETKHSDRYPINPGQVRTNSVTGMEILKGWSSVEGLKSLVESGGQLRQPYSIKDNQPCISKDADFKSIHADLESGSKKLFYFAPSFTEIDGRLSKIIKRYNECIQLLIKTPGGLTEGNLLKVFALTTQLLAQTHPFRDGNNRTIVNCFLNSRLIQFGFPPVLMLDPNVFEFHTVPQLVDIIKKAMEQTRRIMKDPDAEIYGFKNSSFELLQSAGEEKEIFASIKKASEELRSDLENILQGLEVGQISRTGLFGESRKKIDNLMNQLLTGSDIVPGPSL